MDPAPSAVGHATVRGQWTPPRQQWVVCSCQRVPRRARWHLEDGMTWKRNLIKVSMKKSFSLSAKKEQQGSPAQNDGLRKMSSEMPERTPDARAANKEIVQPKRQKEQQGSPAQDDGLERGARLKLEEEEQNTAEPRRDIDRQGEP